MKMAVRYQSRGGNTKAVAEKIANKVGVTAESIDVTIKEYTDILFLGGGVYMQNIDDNLRKYINNLDVGLIGQIVCFSTTGSMKVTLNRIKENALNKGIKVNDKQLLVKMFLRGHSLLGMAGGKLTNKQINQIDKFVEEMALRRNRLESSVDKFQ